MLRSRSVILSLVILLAVGVVACAPQQQQANNSDDVETSSEFQSDLQGPDWFYSPPEKDGSLFASAMATSSRADVAKDKAELKAKRELAATLQSTLEGQRERYIEEIGDSSNSEDNRVREQYQDLTREMVAEELQGVQLREKGFKQEGNTWRAFVLVELTMDDLKDKLSNKEELKTRFNAKQFEDDMEENLKKMRERQQQ